MSVELEDIQANGMVFRCRRAGATGEPVILLHGFPETSHMWTPLMERLAAAGYRCLSPDQRGYSPGARPEGIEHYHYTLLAGDVLALAEAAGFGKFHLIGHDHGAGVGWTTVFLYPERVQSWTALSLPHIAAFIQALRADPDQQARSRYIAFFALPELPESELSANDCQRLRELWERSSVEEVEDYLSVFRQPGALTGALNWYRAALSLQGSSTSPSLGNVHVPTMMVWGNQDKFIGRKANEDTPQYMVGPYKFVELDAGHWLMREETGRVITEALQHLRANPVT